MAALCAGGGAESGNTTASAGQTASHGLGQSVRAVLCVCVCVCDVLIRGAAGMASQGGESMLEADAVKQFIGETVRRLRIVHSTRLTGNREQQQQQQQHKFKQSPVAEMGAATGQAEGESARTSKSTAAIPRHARCTHALTPTASTAKQHQRVARAVAGLLN